MEHIIEAEFQLTKNSLYLKNNSKRGIVVMVCVGSSTTVILLVVTSFACVYSREVTMPSEDIDGVDASLLTRRDVTTTVPEKTDLKIKTKKDVQERAIGRQVHELQKLKCKSYRTKVYTRDYLPSHSIYHDFEVYPEVLSVKKCKPNCSYCLPLKNGSIDRTVCKSTKAKLKKFTIRAYTKHTPPQYFKISILVDLQCQCQPQYVSTTT